LFESGHLLDLSVWTWKEFEELMRDFIEKSLPQGVGFFRAKFEFFKNEKFLFEYLASSNELTIKTNNQDETNNITGSLDRSGLIETDTTFMLGSSQGAFPHKTTKYHDWADWFLENGKNKCIVIDTNIIMNRYCSNILSTKLKERFNDLKIKIPRLTILEIERMANDNNQLKRRLAFFATTEIMFLKSYKAELLPSLSYPLLENFPEKAGSKQVDSWIRQEVRDFLEIENDTIAVGKPTTTALFMTCDLANGLAAFSEGLDTCIFSRVDQEKLIISSSFSDATSITDFILNAAITFENLLMKVYVDGKTLCNVYFIEGIWSGKTPYHWINHSLRLREVEAK
jgi:hypothetical protein